MPATDTASRKNPRAAIWSYLLLAHRYSGITISLIVLLWCISGIVMMYVQYPAMDSSERLRGLQAFSPGADLSGDFSTTESAALVSHFVVESTAAGVLLRTRFQNGDYRALNLATGRWVDKWDDELIKKAAQQYAESRGWSKFTSNALIVRDQWTVQTGYEPHRPLHKFANDDGQEWYVSARTGEVVQTTTALERRWNYLGAVIHWLYPTALRQHTVVWAQTVVWLTLFALFLTVTGLAIGVLQFRRRTSGTRSPYRGLALWHHYAGLVFGVFTLTWLFSGLFSMNPWGALETRSIASERAFLNDVNASLNDVIDYVRSVSTRIPDGTVRLESSYWLGQAFIIAYDRDGHRSRLAAGDMPGTLSKSDMAIAASGMRDGESQVELLELGDRYYYSHHSRREFPVYRITYADGERFYLSAYSGSLLRFVDANARNYRWLFNALHSGDFHASSRSRPIWDVMLLSLLAGVTIGVASGTYLAIKRVLR